MPATERSKLVAATANRLRLIQMDFAEESREARSEYLSEEIERALERVIPQDRPAFLKELMDRFPTWDPNVAVAPVEEAGVPTPETDTRELQDPSFLVSRLLDLAPGLSRTERSAVLERLRQAGLAPEAAAHEWSEEALQVLREKLQIEPDAPLDTNRLLELTAHLAEFAAKLDQVTWSTWRRMSGKTHIRRATIQEMLGRFVAGDDKVSSTQVSEGLERLRNLIAALISAVSRVGQQFASSHLARYSPSRIEALAKMEGGGILTAREVKCWRKYVELAQELSEASVEKDIMNVITTFAEQLMHGLNH